MTTRGSQPLISFSDTAFIASYTAFAFIMFSCWFPTGFASVFSTFAFIFALPVFFGKFQQWTITPHEKCGLILFLWLGFSIFWSQESLNETVEFLSEYRLYFMVPVFTIALASSRHSRRLPVLAAFCGAIIALISSYALGFRLLKIEGAHLSLANHIYHGFIMSIFLAMVLSLTVKYWSILLGKALAVLAIIVVFNVLFIETGRTGYLQVIFVSICVAGLCFGLRRAFISLGLIILCVGIGFVASEDTGPHSLNVTLTKTYENLQRALTDDHFQSSVGYRLEYLRASMEIASDNPIFGVGVGDVESTLEELYVNNTIRALTDNLHNEFMNMQVAAGAPAMLLFFGFVGLIAYSGFKVRKGQQEIGIMLVCVAGVLFISALFNSTIKDFGEKHALMIVLPILSSFFISRSKNK